VHSHVLDNYSQIDSPLHRLPARVKMLVVFALILALVVLRASAVLYAAAFLVLVFAAATSNIPSAFLLKRLLLLEPFVLGVAVLMLFQPHGAAIFMTTVVRTSLCILAIILLANTTPFPEQLAILQTLRVPALMITTLALMYRYLYVLRDEAHRMRDARASRTFTSTRRFNWHTLATVIAQLFARANERAERIYNAMCARGWV
jgi:cobalt/nickel transport system permease protein